MKIRELFFPGRVSVEVATHQPSRTDYLARTSAGPIYRMVLSRGESDPRGVKTTEADYLTSNNRRRRQVTSTLVLNSRSLTFSGAEDTSLGKPCSCFVFSQDGSTFGIDFLQENLRNDRSEQPNLHTLISYRIDYSKMATLDDCRSKCLSGHIAPFNITSSTEAFLLLLDAFSGKDAYKKMTPLQQRLIKQLYHTRIVPLTSNGHVIR